MKLSEFIKTNPSGFANKHGLPVPVITRFLNGQRAISFETAAKIVAATGGQVTYDDLIAEMQERRQAVRKKKENQNG